jgi:hypothetical protein
MQIYSSKYWCRTINKWWGNKFKIKIKLTIIFKFKINLINNFNRLNLILILYFFSLSRNSKQWLIKINFYSLFTNRFLSYKTKQLTELWIKNNLNSRICKILCYKNLIYSKVCWLIRIYRICKIMHNRKMLLLLHLKKWMHTTQGSLTIIIITNKKNEI